MTSLNLLERMNELSDGLIRPFNATREGRRGSISKIPAQMWRLKNTTVTVMEGRLRRGADSLHRYQTVHGVNEERGS